MPKKLSSIDELQRSKTLDEVLACASSNDGRLQALDRFMESVEKFHTILRHTLLHSNDLGRMAEREAMEEARVNHKQTAISFTHFDTLVSFEDDRLWNPPVRVLQDMMSSRAGLMQQKHQQASTNYYHRTLLVTSGEIDADMMDFDACPDICASTTEVPTKGAELKCVDDHNAHSKWLRKDFVLNALRQMPLFSTFIVSNNYSLLDPPYSLMQVVGNTLTTIDLSFNQLSSLAYSLLYRSCGTAEGGDDDGRSVVNTPAFPNLERLLVNNNRLRSMLPIDLFRVDFAPRLSHLNVENNCIVGFTSHLLSAVKRGSLKAFECCNNDFPAEEEDLSEMYDCIDRAAAHHSTLTSIFGDRAIDVVDDVKLSRFPLCVAAVRALKDDVETYFSLTAAGKRGEAAAMCPRCGVCDAPIPPLWSVFAERYAVPARHVEDEGNFFDYANEDSAGGEKGVNGGCSLVDSAVLVSSLSHWARRMAEERQFDLEGLFSGGSDEEAARLLATDLSLLPPVAMYKLYTVLGNLNVPILFFTCGSPTCVDDVVAIVGGDEEAMPDFRKLRYDGLDVGTPNESDDDG